MYTKKKFVLVNVPSSENAYHSFRDFIASFPPIGLATIAAVLENQGYDVKIIDGDAENLGLKGTVARTVEEAPYYVGLTTMTATMDIAGKFFSMLKSELPDTMIILGGPHVSAIPEKTLQEFTEVDIAVIGEGDETIVELMSFLEQGREIHSVKGIAFRKKGHIIKSGDRLSIKHLERLPLPAYHLLNFDLYWSYGWNKWVGGYRAPLGVVFMGRGCYGKCNFCAAHCVFGRGIRYFPIERIKNEIDLFVNEYKIKILYFQDDTFTANRKLVNQVCDFLIEKKYNRKIEIMVSSRVDSIHFQTLQKMRQAGIRWICFGVESGNQEILNRMKKKITIKQIKDAYNNARSAGLFIAGNYMIGHIGENLETAMDTINLACELKQEYVSFAIAIPFPGTELYQHCLDNNIVLPSWNDFGSVNSPPIPLNESLDQAKLMELRNIAVNRFFKRPFYFLELLWKFNTIAVLKDFLKMYFVIRKERKAKRL